MNSKPEWYKNKTVLLGIICILAGIVLNKYFIENLISADAEISSRKTILLIYIIQIFFFVAGVLLIIFKPRVTLRISRDFAFIIGIFGLAVSFIILPPIFSKTLAMSPLIMGETAALWIFSLALALISLFVLFYKGSKRLEISALFMGLLLLVCLELATRLFVVVVTPGNRLKLANLGNFTYLEFSTTQGHPFIQYTRNPNLKPLPVGRGEGKSQQQINRFGFIGPEYTIAKPDGVVRIACLGGSTTATGYPLEMENYLNDYSEDDKIRFEVINFGIGGYTTAHSLVNFVLNVVEFDPDYIVIHHAWNERIVRNFAEPIRTDYSHAFKYYHEPEIPDKYPSRVSVIYRLLKETLGAEPIWKFLATAIAYRGPDEEVLAADRFKWENMEELKPYRRNIESILDLAELRDIKSVLTTMPHTITPERPHYYIYPHIDQCNAIVREISKSYEGKIMFVDLDLIMTGKMDDYFLDLGHMINEGIRFKAEQFGGAILDDWSNSQNGD